LATFNAEQLAEIRRVSGNLRVQKVVCTRSVKTPNGDFFVGFSSGWDSVQEDSGGPGAGLLDLMVGNNAMTFRESKLSALLIARQVEIQAWTNALGGGAISEADHLSYVRAINLNYEKLIQDYFEGKPVSLPTGAQVIQSPTE
jgi:hypothetical protein